jgi:hypothetical protein
MGGCRSKNLAIDPKNSQSIDNADPHKNDLTTPRGWSGRAMASGAGQNTVDPQGTSAEINRPGSGSSNGSKKSFKGNHTSVEDRPEDAEQKPLSAKSHANGAVWSKLRSAVKTIHSLGDGHVDDCHIPIKLQELIEISEKQVNLLLPRHKIWPLSSAEHTV